MSINYKKFTSGKEEVKSFKMGEEDVQVLQYLPVRDKYDLIMITLQKAEEDGSYSELLLDTFFHLNLVYLYTDIIFSTEDKADELALYDDLKCGGVIDKMLMTMNMDEYDYLYDMLIQTRDNILHYSNTAGAVLQRIIQDLPKNAQAAADIVDSFDEQKYQNIVDFAKAAGLNTIVPKKMGKVN